MRLVTIWRITYHLRISRLYINIHVHNWKGINRILIRRISIEFLVHARDHHVKQPSRDQTTIKPPPTGEGDINEILSCRNHSVPLNKESLRGEGPPPPPLPLAIVFMGR